MKKLAITAALLGATTMMAPSAYALNIDFDELFDLLNGCDTLCDPGRADFKQDLYGIQDAVNQIVNIKDATDLVQKAVNAGNLVTVVTTYDEDDVDFAGADYWILNKALGTVTQTANVGQNASNLIDGQKLSDFNYLSQSATNVVNSITGKTAWNLNQNVANVQNASNTMWGGYGGYDDVELDLEDPEYTQTAVNASNLIDISTLKNDIKQVSTTQQNAVNVAAFESKPIFLGPFPIGTIDPDVYDFGQSATNVTNSVTLEGLDLGGLWGGCACGFEVEQGAIVDQLASNLLSTAGNVSNSIQSATNVANSISVPSAP